MLACAFLIFPTVPVATKRKTLPSPNCCLSFHHRRITGSPPVLSSNFWYRLPHYQPSRLASMAPQSTSIAFPIKSTELREEGDFESILTPQGYLYVCGFGSLLSERSARSTFPNVKNFRVAFLPGFRRVFAHIAPIFYERGIAKEETKEVSSLSVEPCEGEGLIVTVFEIARSEISSFIERENEFRFLATVPEALDGAPFANSAVVCARYSDEEYFKIRCKDFSEILRLRSSSAALKVIKIFTFRIMEGITSIRYGGMISYLVVFILDIVSWQPKTLEKQPMIIS